MDNHTVLLGLTLVLGFYMAWNIGANDVANAMGTSVGSGALTVGGAVLIATVLEFSGALFVGSHVSETVRKGIVNPEIFMDEPMLFAYGMLAALFSAGAWLQIASYYGWPVSTTHSIVGSVLGFGLMYGGTAAIEWGGLISIASSWVISPLMSAAISYLIFSLVRRKILFAPNPVKEAKKLTPYLTFFVFFLLALAMVYKGLKNLSLDLSGWEAFLVAAASGIVGAVIAKILVAKIEVRDANGDSVQAEDPAVVAALENAKRQLAEVKKMASGDLRYQVARMLLEIEGLRELAEEGRKNSSQIPDQKAVEKIFTYLQIFSACFVAFAHGANDVANAIGPASAVYSVLQNGVVGVQTEVPLGMLALGGIGMAIGLATWGRRVMETVGKKITELTPTRGFAAQFGTAVTVMLASKLGLPISTTHTLVGGVIGVGLARGLRSLNLGVLREIVVSWVLTIPASAILTVAGFYLLKIIFA